MKLSEQPEYLIAIPAKVTGDLITARSNLEVLVSRARAEGDTLTCGYLLQILGSVEAMAGNIELGHAHHQEAIQLSPTSPQPLLFYAQSLFRDFSRADLALQRLLDAEARMEAPDWKLDALESPRDYYVREFAELRNSILARKP